MITPLPSKNPVDVMMPFVRKMAADLGLEVDEVAFAELRAYCDQPVLIDIDTMTIVSESPE